MQPLNYASPHPPSKPNWDFRLRIISVLALVIFFFFIFYPPNDLARYRKAAWSRCRNNLTTLFQAMQSYAKDHGGKYPDDLKSLVLDGHLHSKHLVCPMSNDNPVDESPGQSLTQPFQEGWTGSYTYLAAGLTLNPATRIPLAHETNPDNHERPGVHVLFSDGSIQYLTPRELKQALGASSASTNASPMP